MVNVFSCSQKKVFPPYLYLMYEDGIVGEHSLHSYGSVGREVKRCIDKAIFCRLHWQERRALVVNEHCYVSFVSFRSFKISSTRVKKGVCSSSCKEERRRPHTACNFMIYSGKMAQVTAREYQCQSFVCTR